MNNAFIDFTHANFNCPVQVSRPLIFSVYYSEAHKATHIISNGGAIAPVKESLEEVLSKINQTKKEMD